MTTVEAMNEAMEIIEDGGSFYCPVCQNKVCPDAAFCCACGQRLGETGEAGLLQRK